MDNKTILKNNLIDITKVLNNHSIPSFLLFGTLLGIVRDNDFINGDLDVDIGVIIPGGIDLNAWFKIFKNLEQLGFTLRRAGTSSVITLDRGFGLDIWWVFKKWDENKKSYYGIRGWNGEFVYPVQNFDALSDITWQNKTFKIPFNPELYLETTYGKDWKIPNPNFKHPGDSPCFTPNRRV